MIKINLENMKDISLYDRNKINVHAQTYDNTDRQRTDYADIGNWDADTNVDNFAQDASISDGGTTDIGSLDSD